MIGNLKVETKLMCTRHYFMLKKCGRIHKKVFTRGEVYKVNSVKPEFVTLSDDDDITHLLNEKDLTRYFYPI